MFALAAAITLAVWGLIGTVLGVEAILAAPHTTLLGEAALLTALGWGDVLAALFIWFGPFSEWLEYG